MGNLICGLPLPLTGFFKQVDRSLSFSSSLFLHVQVELNTDSGFQTGFQGTLGFQEDVVVRARKEEG